MINGSIDVTKIAGAKFFKKDGREFLEITNARLHKGRDNDARYMNITLVDTLKSPHSDWMVKHDLGKEARRAGEEAPILGNAIEYEGEKWIAKHGQKQQQAPQRREAPPREDDEDPIPF